MSFTIKQGDTWPPLKATLQQEDNSAISLVGATVEFIMVTSKGVCLINNVVGILDDGKGKIQYSWQAGNTDRVGKFQGEFKVTFSSGKVARVPNTGSFEVNVVKKLYTE